MVDKTKEVDDKVDEVVDDKVVDEPKEKMIPESRLRGLAKENALLNQKLKTLEEQVATKATEGLSEAEKLKVRYEALEAKHKEVESTNSGLATKLKRSAVKAHFGSEISTPRVVDLIDLASIEVDENGELTDTAKTYLKEWRNQPENKPLFQTQRRPGNTPTPGDTNEGMTRDQYVKIMADPKATPREKQIAHEKFMRSVAR